MSKRGGVPEPDKGMSVDESQLPQCGLDKDNDHCGSSDSFVVEELFAGRAYMKLYDVLDDRLETFDSEGEAVGVYVCGITPYDTTHIGHAATFVWVDALARVLAQDEKRVLIVDCDLRKANLHTRLNVPREPGFTDFFIRQVELSGLIRTKGHAAKISAVEIPFQHLCSSKFCGELCGQQPHSKRDLFLKW